MTCIKLSETLTLLSFSTERKPCFLPSSSSSDLFEDFMTSPMPLLFFSVFLILFISSRVFTEVTSDVNLAACNPMLHMVFSPTYSYTSITIFFTLCFISLCIFYLLNRFRMLSLHFFIPLALLLPKHTCMWILQHIITIKTRKKVSYVTFAL